MTDATDESESIPGRATYVRLAVDLPPDLLDAVDAHCRRKGVTKRAVVELALRRLLVSEAGA